MSLWRRMLQAIKAYYFVPQEVAFRQFRMGLICFGLGLGAILVANVYMEDSLQQELAALGGMVIGGLGFVVGLIGQSRLLVSRLLHFWVKHD
jgi:hypothetical protein